MDIIKNVTSNIQNKEGLRVSSMFFNLYFGLN